MTGLQNTKFNVLVLFLQFMKESTGINFWMGRLGASWFLFIFCLLFFIQYPAYYILLRSPGRYPYVNKLRRIWARLLFRLTGVGWKLIRLPGSQVDGPCVFCANHHSYIDIPLMALAANNQYHFMAKAELLDIPVFRLFFQTIDIPVPRERKLGSHDAFLKASNWLQKGDSLVVFPEGGILPNPPLPKSFRMGAFKAAVGANVPIIPVSLHNSWWVMSDEVWPRFRWGRCRIVCHPALYPADYEYNEKKLAEATRNIIIQSIEQYGEHRQRNHPACSTLGAA
jgi:1-acyl-sn-glycerol-3-phosphate acyltransferase